MNEIIIEENNFIQMTNQDTESYIRELDERVSLGHIDVDLKEVKRENQVQTEQQKRLEEAYEKAEDYNYMPYCHWLETFIPYYAKKYGPFNYSSNDLTNKQKIAELLNYYNKIHILNETEDIRKKKPHRGLFH